MYVLASYFYCCMSYLIVLKLFMCYLCLCFFLAAFLFSLLIYAAFGKLS